MRLALDWEGLLLELPPCFPAPGAAVQAAARFKSGMRGCEHVFELHYNAALLAHRQGDLQEALSQVCVSVCGRMLSQCGCCMVLGPCRRLARSMLQCPWLLHRSHAALYVCPGLCRSPKPWSCTLNTPTAWSSRTNFGHN